MTRTARLLTLALLLLSINRADAKTDQGNAAGKKSIRVAYYKPNAPAPEIAKVLNKRYPTKGKATLLITVSTKDGGCYAFRFSEKLTCEPRTEGGDSSDVYGIKENGEMGVVSRYYNEPYTITVKNIYAYVLSEDHGTYIEKCKFQDFGNEIYFPNFLYRYCLVDDADGDGKPEFYLTYFASSDGLDAKPLKVIVYGNELTKSKATAYYPAGNEEDVYHVEYDSSWSKLPLKIQQRVKAIIKEVKDTNAVDALP
jgi:hypothetical protein